MSLYHWLVRGPPTTGLRILDRACKRFRGYCGGVLYAITMAGERAGAKKTRPLRNRSKGSLEGSEMTQEDKPLEQSVSGEVERGSRESEKAKLGTVEGMEKQHPSSRLVVTCFLGIFVSYFIYGLLQEKMYESSGSSAVDTVP